MKEYKSCIKTAEEKLLWRFMSKVQKFGSIFAIKTQLYFMYTLLHETDALY